MIGFIVATLLTSSAQVIGRNYKADCLIFLLKDCPIANQYMPEIKRLETEYRAKGIQLQIVLEDSDGTAKDLDKIRRDFKLVAPMMIDSAHTMSRGLGVTISPTAVVRMQSHVYYVGRIDDRYPSIGKRRTVSKAHELRDALDSVVAGKSVKVPKTEAVGCRLY
jgi:hypothetical protein